VFTGIVEERGTVRVLETGPDDGRLEVECATVLEDSVPGASLSVNGACLTVREREGAGSGAAPDGAGILLFDLSPETLDRTTLGGLRPGDPVNLERPVTLLTRLGGHLVQGHVDGVGVVERVDQAGTGADVRIALPPIHLGHLSEKGSVAVDGVSLTVTSVTDDGFTVALVPHTLAVTTFGGLREGDRVNVEVDIVAKYVEAVMRR
jgi:riboflavin synthase